MKSIGFLGLLFVLLMVAYSKVEGSPGEAARGPDRSVNMAAPVSMEGRGNQQVKPSEYVFLHHARYENLPVHAMAGVTTCPE